MASLTDDPFAEMKQRYVEEPERSRVVPEESMSARIARLAKEVALASDRLDVARRTCEKAIRIKEEEAARFVSLSDELMQAIHAHREGASEGVPYQP